MTQISWQYQVNNRAGGYIVTNTDWNDVAGDLRAFIDQTTSSTTDNTPLPIGIDLVNDRVYISDPDSTTPEDGNHADTTLSVVGTTTLNGNVTLGVDDTGVDLICYGATSGAYMKWDQTTDDLQLVGAAGLDIAGDVDVDGTTNLDEVDIDGTVQIDNTVTVGVNDSGYDVKFFGATATNGYMLWDQSTDDLILGSSSNLGLGATSPDYPLHISTTDNRPIGIVSSVAGSYLDMRDTDTTGEGYVSVGAVGNELRLIAGGSLRLTIDSTGLLVSPRSYSATTGNDPNLWVDSDGSIYRSTAGSIRLKTDVEDAGDSYADKVMSLRPIWFRSLATADRRDWSHWGLIAEEVAEIDPRLVHWGWVPVEGDDGEQVVDKDDERVWELDADGEKVLRPDGVQYTKIVPLLINIIKRQDTRIAALEAA